MLEIGYPHALLYFLDTISVIDLSRYTIQPNRPTIRLNSRLQGGPTTSTLHNPLGPTIRTIPQVSYHKFLAH